MQCRKTTVLSGHRCLINNIEISFPISSKVRNQPIDCGTISSINMANISQGFKDLLTHNHRNKINFTKLTISGFAVGKKC